MRRSAQGPSAGPTRRSLRCRQRQSHYPSPTAQAHQPQAMTPQSSSRQQLHGRQPAAQRGRSLVASGGGRATVDTRLTSPSRGAAWSSGQAARPNRPAAPHNPTPTALAVGDPHPRVSLRYMSNPSCFSQDVRCPWLPPRHPCLHTWTVAVRSLEASPGRHWPLPRAQELRVLY